MPMYDHGAVSAGLAVTLSRASIEPPFAPDLGRVETA